MTCIYELDQINVATEGMHKELVATLEDKWKKDYDQEAKESLDAIIRNSEKIALSVLDILKK